MIKKSTFLGVMQNNLIATVLLSLFFFASCDEANLPEADLEFISYVYAKTDSGEWQSCQSFVQHFPSLEKVGEATAIECLEEMLCVDVDSRSRLMAYIRARSHDNLFLKYFSFINYETEEGIFRSCQSYIMGYPDLENIGFHEVIDCLDLAICQSPEGHSEFVEWFHQYLQAL